MVSENSKRNPDGGDLSGDRLLPSPSRLSQDQVIVNRREKAGPEMALPFLSPDLPGKAAHPCTG
jgi:hypothetical protein